MDQTQSQHLRMADTTLGAAELVALAARAKGMLDLVRESMLKPHPTKNPPEFSTTQVSGMCHINKPRLNYLAGQGILPPGTLQGAGRSRVFTLKEARAWIKASGVHHPRPEGQRGRVIAVANFKGGSTKTSTAMTLAQGLTLHGRKVLLVDLDPQASATNLCGLLPDAEITEDMTVMPFIYKEQPDLRYATRPTYWDGLDLIPATNALFGAEFLIPSTVSTDASYPFWAILANGLEPLMNEYDAIVIDTAPSLSYMTINAMMAADGLLVPLPPSALDYASSTQFWSLFSELAMNFHKRDYEKRFDFVNILLTRVDLTDPASSVVREWIMQTYGDKVLPIEIPKSTVTSSTSAEFGTPYDVTKWVGSAKTYARAREAYDRVAALMDQKLVMRWYNGIPEPVSKAFADFADSAKQSRVVEA